jgi:hypothetical protein
VNQVLVIAAFKTIFTWGKVTSIMWILVKELSYRVLLSTISKLPAPFPWPYFCDSVASRTLRSFSCLDDIFTNSSDSGSLARWPTTSCSMPMASVVFRETSSPHSGCPGSHSSKVSGCCGPPNILHHGSRKLFAVNLPTSVSKPVNVNALS